MTVIQTIEAVFIYPYEAIPTVERQVVDRQDVGLVELPFGAYGFVFNEVVAGTALTPDGVEIPIEMRGCSSPTYYVGEAYNYEDLLRLKPFGYKVLLADLEETDDYDEMVLTSFGFWTPRDEDQVIVAVSELKPLDLSTMLP